MEVEWEAGSEDTVYVADIQVVSLDRQGLLRDISALFSDHKINVTGVRTRSIPRDDTAIMNFTTEVSSAEQLDGVISHISQYPGVLRVSRKNS